MRLPRIAKAILAMMVYGCCLLLSSSLQGVKQRSNLQTTIHPSLSLRDFVEVVAIHKPQKSQYKNRKEKELFTIHQAKELIFNEI